MHLELRGLRRLERFQKNRRRVLAVATKAKAWAPKSSDLGSRFYVFKGRIGKTAVGSGNYFDFSRARFLFRLKAQETGNLTAPHMEVIWKNIRRKVRRFGVNFKRISLNLCLYPVLTKTQTKRPKGGRMGSGKSGVSGRMAPIRRGQTLIEWKEFRSFPFRSLLELRNVSKKLPMQCYGELVYVAF